MSARKNSSPPHTGLVLCCLLGVGKQGKPVCSRDIFVFPRGHPNHPRLTVLLISIGHFNRPFPSSLAELILIWKVSHLNSFWNRGTRELGNGLLTSSRQSRGSVVRVDPRQKPVKQWYDGFIEQAISYRQLDSKKLHLNDSSNHLATTKTTHSVCSTSTLHSQTHR